MQESFYQIICFIRIIGNSANSKYSLEFFETNFSVCVI